jgi:predicted TIM-barrel fold metal-dependent hydrolase
MYNEIRSHDDPLNHVGYLIHSDTLPYSFYKSFGQGWMRLSNPNFLRIDVHHHIAPHEYVKELNSLGITHAGGAPIQLFDVQQTLELMDRHQIQAAITSISSPGVYFGDATASAKLARICNEFSAKLIGEYPDRFGAFAVLPLPDVHAALHEIEYAYDILKLDGFVLMTSYDDIYLGNPRFEEIFQELEKRKAVVFIHPDAPQNAKNIKIGVPDFTLEFIFDTTRTVTSLIVSGTMERYPSIRFILSHAGGTVPFAAWRIARGILAAKGVSPKERISRTEEITSVMQKFYYDTALSAAPNVFRSLQELVETSQILFGSDYPFANEDVTHFTINGINGYEGFTEEDREKIHWKNAAALFPRVQMQR